MLVKRVLFVCDSFKMGGIQSSMINLANALQAYCQVDLYYSQIKIDRIHSRPVILIMVSLVR